MIVAALIITDHYNAVGKSHSVISHLPAYIKYFENITGGAPLIMGRKTFESLGQTLTSKRNIIITRNEKYHSVRARTCGSLQEALEMCANEEKVFVMGGIDLYKEALPLTSEIYRTSIMARFKSETFYPEIDEYDFTLETSVCIQRDKENMFDYCVEKWVKPVDKLRKV